MRHPFTPCSTLLIAAALTAGAAIAPATAAPADPSEVSARPDVPNVYFVPMRGQMGTDVHPSVYEDVVKDIKKKDVDLVVYVLNCADVNNVFYLNDDNPVEASLFMLGEYRQIVQMLHDELGDIPQVMWVEDSVGFGSLMALAWDEMYMTTDARLAGLGKVLAPVMQWKDPDVRAKMLAAWTGIGKGFLVQGGYPLELGEAMMRPEKRLSCKFKGRSVEWKLDTDGTWVIDGDDKRTAQFTAQLAEDTGLADGLADTKDDLMFLLGYREYNEVEGSEKIVDRYVEDWRATLERTVIWAEEYADALGWATGEDTIKYLGQAKDRLERIRGAMIKYPAIEIRWRQTNGTGKDQLEIQIEQIKEQIRGLKSRDRGRGGSRGSGGGLSGGGGGRRR